MAKIEGENHQKTKNGTPGKNERRSRRGGFGPRQPNNRRSHPSGGSGSGGSNSRNSSKPSTPRDKLQSSTSKTNDEASSIMSGLKHANEIGMVTAGIGKSQASSIDVEKQVFVPYKVHNDKSPSRVLPQHASPSRSKQQGRGLPQSKGKQKGSVGKATGQSPRRSSKEKNPVVYHSSKSPHSSVNQNNITANGRFSPARQYKSPYGKETNPNFSPSQQNKNKNNRRRNSRRGGRKTNESQQKQENNTSSLPNSNPNVENWASLSCDDDREHKVLFSAEEDQVKSISKVELTNTVEKRTETHSSLRRKALGRSAVRNKSGEKRQQPNRGRSESPKEDPKKTSPKKSPRSSKSKSPRSSKSKSPRSRSKSPRLSKSKSPRRSKSPKSRSKSPRLSKSKSPRRSKSPKPRSKSPRLSKSKSPRRSKSPASARRSKSPKVAKSPRTSRSKSPKHVPKSPRDSGTKSPKRAKSPAPAVIRSKSPGPPKELRSKSPAPKSPRTSKSTSQTKPVAQDRPKIKSTRAKSPEPMQQPRAAKLAEAEFNAKLAKIAADKNSKKVSSETKPTDRRKSQERKPESKEGRRKSKSRERKSQSESKSPSRRKSRSKSPKKEPQQQSSDGFHSPGKKGQAGSPKGSPKGIMFKRRRISSPGKSPKGNIPSSAFETVAKHLTPVADDMLAITLIGVAEEFRKYVPAFNNHKVTVDQIISGQLTENDYREIGIEEDHIPIFLYQFSAKASENIQESSHSLAKVSSIELETEEKIAESLSPELTNTILINQADQIYAIGCELEKVEKLIDECPEEALIQKNECSLPTGQVPIEGFCDEVEMIQTTSESMHSISQKLEKMNDQIQEAISAIDEQQETATQQTNDGEDTKIPEPTPQTKPAPRTEAAGDSGNAADNVKYALLFSSGAALAFLLYRFIKH